MPVPIEAKRMVSLGATGRGDANSMRGCTRDLATVVATTALEPICMNWRRDRGFFDMGIFALTSAGVFSGTSCTPVGEIVYGEELSHSERLFSKTIFYAGMLRDA